jgi:Xaa-Pro aminopeptidase
MVVPRLELAAAEAGIRTDLEIRTWDETDDPYALAVSGITTTGRVAVSDTMLAMHLLRIQAALGDGPTYLPASTVLRDLRMIKDDDEISLLRAAAYAADRVVAAIAGGTLVGRTEAMSPRGPRAAHRRGSRSGDVRDRRIRAELGIAASRGIRAGDPAGEPIVLDIGGTLGGYGSDITRTLWVTGGDDTRRPDGRSLICSAPSTRPRPQGPGRSAPGSPARPSMPRHGT